MKDRTKPPFPAKQDLERLLSLYQGKQYRAAEKLAISLTKKFPLHDFAWKVLGGIFQQAGKTAKSLIANKKAVELSPGDAANHNNLGNVLKASGRSNEAKTSYEKALALSPRYVEAYYNLGNTLKNLGKLNEAEANFRKAITLMPHLAEAHNNLGVTLMELGKFSDAEESFRRAVGLKPDYAEAHNNLGITQQELGRLDQALSSYRKTIALKPDFAEAHNNLGNTLKKMRRLEEAKASYEQSIELRPGFAEAHNNLGVTHQELGKFEEAKTQYKKAILAKPNFAEAHRHFALLKKFDSKDDQFLKMSNIYFDSNTSEEHRCHINFALAKAHEDLNDFEQAFLHYNKGNSLRKKLLNYNANHEAELFKQIKANYPQIKQSTPNTDRLPIDLIPIFIVGMPRSGTTIVEQIISAHSEVKGAGELPFAAEFGENIAYGSTEQSIESVLNFRKKYLERLRHFSDGKLIVTDKMPQNFRYIGLLATAFPEAKIIHVKRSPAAVCWANYKQYFISRDLGYSYSLLDTIEYYKLYETLMAFWDNSLRDRIFHLDYELMVKNQETETRQLISHLGLDWDEKCLAPQKNKRSVATASSSQVRKKVYQGSSENWRNYEPFLNGLLDQFS